MKKMNFEESLTRLEEIAQALEKGDIPLDESLKIFEEGVKLSRFCEKKLTEAEQKLEILKSTDIENIQIEDEDSEETDEDETKIKKKKNKKNQDINNGDPESFLF